MKYRVLRTNYGFQGQFWNKGDEVDLDPKTNPPEFFQPMEVSEPPEPVGAVEPEPEAPLPVKAKAPTVKKVKPAKKLK